MRLYVDSSAFVAAVAGEPGSLALRENLAGGRPPIASALLEIEAARALAGCSAEVRSRAEHLLATIDLVDIDRGIVARAAQLAPGVRMRSLDAIHLATALSVPEPVTMVTLDQRLKAASMMVGVGLAAT